MTRFTVAFLVAAVPVVAFAQTPANPPVRIRGIVEKLEGQNLIVKDRSGQSMAVKLADNFVVVGIFKGSVADIDPRRQGHGRRDLRAGRQERARARRPRIPGVAEAG